MNVIPRKSYSEFKKDIPREFIATKGEKKGRKVPKFREVVGEEILRFKRERMTTTGHSSHREGRWLTWLDEVPFDEDTWNILKKIDDNTVSGLKYKQSNIDFYIAIYYRFHAVLDDMTFADAIDTEVFGELLREQGQPVFARDTKPTAPFIHPPYVSESYVRQRLERDPTDGIWLNPHNHHFIKLSGREKEKAHLDAFMARKEGFLICPVIAPSGAGKTRLISEWMKPYVPSVSATDWDAGFVASRDPKPWTKHEWTIERDTLIVIDYTFAYTQVVKEIAQRARADGTGRKIRLIVIDHIFPKDLFDDVFWQGLYQTRSIMEGHHHELYPALEIQPEGSQSELLRDVATAVASGGDKIFHRDHATIMKAVDALYHMGKPSDGHGGHGNPDAVRHPLFAALVGHAIRSGRDFSHWSRRDLIQYYFSNADRLPWKAWSKVNNRDNWGIAVGALVSAATLRRGLPLFQVERFLPGDLEALVQYAHRIVSSEDFNLIRPLEPDLVGEAFLLEFLKVVRNDADAKRTFLNILTHDPFNRDANHIGVNVQEVIVRLIRNLANDDPSLRPVSDGWSVVCDLLKPEQFEVDSPVRLSISYCIVDALLRILTEHYAPSDELNSESALQHLDEIRFVLERQFCKDDILRACATGTDLVTSALSAFHFFEVSSFGNANENREFLIHAARLFSAGNSHRATATIIAASYGLVGVLKELLEHLREDIIATDMYDRTALMMASTNGHTQAVAILLDHGADIDERFHDGAVTPLISACSHGHAETAKLLLDRGAKLDQAATALVFACDNGHEKTAALLLDRGIDVNRGAFEDGLTPLLAASRSGHAEVAALLLDRGAEVNQGAIDDGRTALIMACLNGQAETAVLLLDRGAEIDLTSTGPGGTALMAACESGHVEIVALLLERGADVNKRSIEGGWTALMAASQSGLVATTALLLGRGAEINRGRTDNGWTALMAASANGHLDIASLLLDHGAEIDQGSSDSGATALIAASQYGHVRIVGLLLDRGAEVNRSTINGSTALLAASANGHLDVASLLLDHGAEVNQGRTTDGWSALILSSMFGYLEVTALLLDRGAEIDKGSSNSGATALIAASQYDHVGIVGLLLDRGAEVNRGTNDGSTALMTAAMCGHVDVAVLLLDRGATVDQGDSNSGTTALIAASQYGHVGIVGLLLDRGAEVNRGANDGSTALDYAITNNHNEIVDLLSRAGACAGGEMQ